MTILRVVHESQDSGHTVYTVRDIKDEDGHLILVTLDGRWIRIGNGSVRIEIPSN